MHTLEQELYGLTYNSDDTRRLERLQMTKHLRDLAKESSKVGVGGKEDAQQLLGEQKERDKICTNFKMGADEAEQLVDDWERLRMRAAERARAVQEATRKTRVRKGCSVCVCVDALQVRAHAHMSRGHTSLCACVCV